jgi:GNAT superfamily N-acetyltransferase
MAFKTRHSLEVLQEVAIAEAASLVRRLNAAKGNELSNGIQLLAQLAAATSNRKRPDQLHLELAQPKTVKVTSIGLEFDLKAIEQAGLTETYQSLKGALGASRLNALLNAFATGGAEAMYRVAPNLSLYQLGQFVSLVYGLSNPVWHDLQHLFGKVTSGSGGSYNVGMFGEINTGEFRDVIDVTEQILNRMGSGRAEVTQTPANQDRVSGLPAGYSIKDNVDRLTGAGSVQLLDASGKQVGIVFTVPLASDPYVIRISGILIDQSQRSKGLGSALMRRVEELFEYLGYDRLELSVVPGTEQFYERLGFKPLSPGSSTWSKPLGQPDAF